MMPSTQRQRSNARKRRDKEDSVRAAERANDTCETCGTYAPYEKSGQNHHDYRKNNNPELRHDPRNHHWQCQYCHRYAHENVIKGHEEMYKIRLRRGDDLELHQSARNFN